MVRSKSKLSSRKYGRRKIKKLETRISAKKRHLEFQKDTYYCVITKRLFCKACEKVLDHTRKSPIVQHLMMAKKHLANTNINKKRKSSQTSIRCSIDSTADLDLPSSETLQKLQLLQSETESPSGFSSSSTTTATATTTSTTTTGIDTTVASEGEGNFLIFNS